MKNITVAFTAGAGLCTGCGICKNICPTKCISWKRLKGQYVPVVDSNVCVNCGLCSDVCPGLEMTYPSNCKETEAIIGNCLTAYNAWSCDPKIRHLSASGGVITTIVSALLKSNEYNVAFLVDEYCYDHQLKTKPYTDIDVSLDSANYRLPKSRYLAVSHENAVAYILNNKNDKVILIGTACAIRGLDNVIKRMGLMRENYLLIGLFCDSVFNYNIWDYYSTAFSSGKTLNNIHFKDKDSGGWPGNMKMEYSDGSSQFLDKKERTSMKEYFMPERCLYCADKLNVKADLSVGDNYTEQNSSSLGSNSVVIRTSIGEKAWNAAGSLLNCELIAYDKIQKAQFLDGRCHHLYYSKLEERKIQRKHGIKLQLNNGVNLSNKVIDYEYSWKKQKDKIKLGEDYEPGTLIKDQIAKQNSNSSYILAKMERIYYSVRRRIMR